MSNNKDATAKLSAMETKLHKFMEENASNEVKNAAAPITGGVSCPLVDDATSTAPARSAENPVRFISGMVNVPVVTTLAIELPE